MKAIVYSKYGSPDVLRCEEIEKPTAGDDEVLLKVYAASANPLDWHLMKGKPYIARILFGLGEPKVRRPGRDVAGQVEAVGSSVTRFKPGDEVFGTCLGAFAEYACTVPSKLAIKPANVTFEQAASAPIAALTALQGLRDTGQIRPGQKILINGAAGGVGTFAVQIAKSFGAEVTGVCNTRNVEMVRSLGADRVIDYTKENFTEQRKKYDLIYDCVLNHSLSALRQVLNRPGVYIMVGGPNPSRSMGGLLVHWVTALVVSPFVSQNLKFFMAKSNSEDLTIIGELIATGKVRPVIDRCYRLNEVPEAMRYLGTGHARGKLVITLV